MKALVRSGFVMVSGILLGLALAVPALTAPGPAGPRAVTVAPATEAPLHAGTNADPDVRQVAVSCPPDRGPGTGRRACGPVSAREDRGAAARLSPARRPR